MRIPPAAAGILCILLARATPSASHGARYEAGLGAGYEGGPAGSVHFTTPQLSAAVPLQVRATIGYAIMDPGRAEEARRIFINDAAGGTPAERGRCWNFGLDLLRPIAGGAARRLDLFAGLRHGRFAGHFQYIGDNEEFDVTSQVWGVGVGVEGSAAVTPRLALAVSGGVRFFPRSNLHGHDTTYAPDNENVHARRDYDYADADRAIDQPGTEVTLLGGMRWRFSP